MSAQEKMHQTSAFKPDMMSLFRSECNMTELNGKDHHSSLVKKAITALGWRGHYCNAKTYPVSLQDGFLLQIEQVVGGGELSGLGTGAAVWPAAIILLKYMEMNLGHQLRGKGIMELGCGTGVLGLGLAHLGARVVLTDQKPILRLTENNVKSYICSSKSRKDQSGTTSADIKVKEYNWGDAVDEMEGPFDYIVVSDCILPKLYPIAPLVDALDLLVGTKTVAVISYEHRYYPDFDPRIEFEKLLRTKGLLIRKVDRKAMHPIYNIDDIEIWHIQRSSSCQ